MSSILALLAPYCSNIIVKENGEAVRKETLTEEEIQTILNKKANMEKEKKEEQKKQETKRTENKVHDKENSQVKVDPAKPVQKEEQKPVSKTEPKKEESKKPENKTKEQQTDIKYDLNRDIKEVDNHNKEPEVQDVNFIMLDPEEKKETIKSNNDTKKKDSKCININDYKKKKEVKDEKHKPETIEILEGEVLDKNEVPLLPEKEEIQSVDFTPVESKEEKDSDKIAMSERKVNPIRKITEREPMKIKINATKNVPNNEPKKDDEEEHRLQHLISYLNNMGARYTVPQRMPTGLYEFDVIQFNGNPVRISVDINGLLYFKEIKFYIGHMNPGDEYDPYRRAIMMTNNSVSALIAGIQIDPMYYVPDDLVALNRLLDVSTLKETNNEKRDKTFRKAAKIIFETMKDDIIKYSNGEFIRFAFSRYSSPNEFTIVSSRRNLSSNLSNDKILVTRELWINIKRGKDVTLEVK